MKKYTFLLISALVVLGIIFISFEVPHFSKMTGFRDLLWLTISLSLGIVMILYITWWSRLKGEDKWVAGGSSILFASVITFGILSFANRRMANHHCTSHYYKVYKYEPRYTSAYGVTESGDIKPNHWLLTIEKDDRLITFTLEKNIIQQDVTNTINLEFCKGILSTQYLKE